MRGSTSAAVTAVRLPGSALRVSFLSWPRRVFFFFLCSLHFPPFLSSSLTATPPKPDGHRSTLSSEASEATYGAGATAAPDDGPTGSGRQQDGTGGAGPDHALALPAPDRARLASTGSDAGPSGPPGPLTPPPLGDAGGCGSGGPGEAGGGDVDAGAGLAAPLRSVRWVDADGGAALAAVREFEASEDGDGSEGSGGGGVGSGGGGHPACCSLM